MHFIYTSMIFETKNIKKSYKNVIIKIINDISHKILI